MSWAARMSSGIGLSDLVLSGIGPLSCPGAEPGLGPPTRQCGGSRSRTAVRRQAAVHRRAGAAAPCGRQDAGAAVAAVLAGVLRAGAARAVHDTPFMTLAFMTL